MWYKFCHCSEDKHHGKAKAIAQGHANAIGQDQDAANGNEHI
jgi:hypothetical protein